MLEVNLVTVVWTAFFDLIKITTKDHMDDTLIKLTENACMSF